MVTVRAARSIASSRAAARKTSNEGQVQVDNVVGIQLVDNTTEVLVINRFGTIIRIDTKSVRAAGRRCSSATPCHAVTQLLRS